MKYDIHTLPNGLRIILAPQAGSHTATVMVMAGTGSRYEDPKENGLAHFLEHMFFKGTRRRTSARVISEELDAIGSVYNAFTSKERTAYYAKVSDTYIDTAIDVITDIFLHSTLPPKEITKERGAIIQEIDMYEDMPMRTIDNVLDALLFGTDHPLGRTILGPKENIRSFTRTDFAKYLKKNYSPANTVVSIAGSFDSTKVLAKIKKEFGGLKATPGPTYRSFMPAQTTAAVLIKQKKTDQTQLMIGIRAYPYGHRDEYALAVLATILGGGMSSRLFTELREKRGLAYSVQAWVDKYPDVGTLVVQAGVEHGKLEKAVTTILAEFKKIVRNKVPLTELRKAQAYIKGTLALSLETSDHVAENAATSLINTGRVQTLEEILEQIDKVTVADIQRVAKDIMKTNALNLAVIGPHSEHEALRTLLKL